MVEGGFPPPLRQTRLAAFNLQSIHGRGQVNEFVQLFDYSTRSVFKVGQLMTAVSGCELLDHEQALAWSCHVCP